LINPSNGSGFLTQEQIDDLLVEYEPMPVELEAGEVVLLHNWTLHSSSTNHTDIPRRAFSICYMDAATKSSGGSMFSLIFGENSLSVEQLEAQA